jgi:hypothetical protein
MSCIYCGSKSYGKGCIFSPTNTHIHMDSTNSCIYCGSKYVGSGCLFNPYGKIHVKSPEFLNRVQEQVKDSIVLSYLYEKVKQTNLNKYITPLSRFYKRLSEIISSTGSCLLEVFEMQNKSNFTNLNKEHYIQATEIKKRLIKHYSEINETLKIANANLPEEVIEKILIDAIMVDNANTKF